jgi:mannosyltransferase OCH1-like enzyme
MIPHVIHYCWFGGKPLPKLAVACIASWRKYLPDYEIKEWNESNFDVNMIPYTSEAYAARKYAFVSDYARFWILYHYGGIYFDTDVEVIQPLAPLLEKGAFMGVENRIDRPGQTLCVAPGLGLACEPQMPVYKELLALYDDRHFNVDGKLDLTTVVKITTDFLWAKGLKNINELQQVEGLYIYPAEYLASRTTPVQIIERTAHSYCIHHYARSWQSPRVRLKKKVQSMLPFWLNHALVRLKAWCKAR